MPVMIPFQQRILDRLYTFRMQPAPTISCILYHTMSTTFAPPYSYLVIVSDISKFRRLIKHYAPIHADILVSIISTGSEFSRSVCKQTSDRIPMLHWYCISTTIIKISSQHTRSYATLIATVYRLIFHCCVFAELIRLLTPCLFTPLRQRAGDPRQRADRRYGTMGL